MHIVKTVKGIFWFVQFQAVLQSSLQGSSLSCVSSLIWKTHFKTKSFQHLKELNPSSFNLNPPQNVWTVTDRIFQKLTSTGKLLLMHQDSPKTAWQIRNNCSHWTAHFFPFSGYSHGTAFFITILKKRTTTFSFFPVTWKTLWLRKYKDLSRQLTQWTMQKHDTFSQVGPTCLVSLNPLFL